MRLRGIIGVIGVLSVVVIFWSTLKHGQMSCTVSPERTSSPLDDGLASETANAPPCPECPPATPVCPPVAIPTCPDPAPVAAPAAAPEAAHTLPEPSDLQDRLNAAQRREADLLAVIRALQPEPPAPPPPGSIFDQAPDTACICPGCSCSFFYNRMGYHPTPDVIAEKDQTNYTGSCDRFSEQKKEYVVLYDPGYDDWFPDELVRPVLNCKCGIRCKWTKSVTPESMRVASALVYFSMGAKPPPNARPDLHLVSYHLEPPGKSGYYDPNDTRQRHLSFSYLLNYSVPVTYFEFNVDPKKSMLPRTTPKSSEFVAVALVSNCKDKFAVERANLLKELQQYLPVKILGQAAPHDPNYGCEFLANHQLPVAAHPECGDITHHGTRNSKVCVMSKYKFYLALENSKSLDYVSEKMLWAFEAGAIPIYRGAPNAKQFAPGNHSVIWWDDFASVKDLADYILKVASNQQLYDEYFEYLNHPYSPGWLRMREMSWDTGFCRLCEKLSELERIRETAAATLQELHAKPRKEGGY
eukprot:TRINITY_DN6341_c0_g1_i1.p1 TRINITY_DN6341_c0_g1~~TRINITY_DN6341_c0_g1_i1.p1  ORF type:complete len:526 (+),score=140.93 TRINITY_DN6341_c0_g1_i1:140-1717(+)